MAKEVSPYSIRHNRQPRQAQVTILAEDVESNAQDDLQKYWRIVRKHLGLVLAVFAASLTLTVVHDMMATPLYTASSTVLIRANQPRLLENATVTIVSPGSQFDSGGEDQTQIELLKSRAARRQSGCRGRTCHRPELCRQADCRADRHAARRGRAVGEEQNRCPGASPEGHSHVAGKWAERPGGFLLLQN